VTQKKADVELPLFNRSFERQDRRNAVPLERPWGRKETSGKWVKCKERKEEGKPISPVPSVDDLTSKAELCHEALGTVAILGQKEARKDSKSTDKRRNHLLITGKNADGAGCQKTEGSINSSQGLAEREKIIYHPRRRTPFRKKKEPRPQPISRERPWTMDQSASSCSRNIWEGERGQWVNREQIKEALPIGKLQTNRAQRKLRKTSWKREFNVQKGGPKLIPGEGSARGGLKGKKKRRNQARRRRRVEPDRFVFKNSLKQCQKNPDRREEEIGS